MKNSTLFKPLRLWFFSVGFALVGSLGDSFLYSGSTEWLLQNLSKAVFLFIIRLFGCFIAARVFLSLLQLDRKVPPKPAEKHTLLFAVIIGLCWLPYIFCTWPGSVSNDSNTQLRMIVGLIPLTADNPLFQTLLISLFRRFGLWLGSIDIGIAGYCLLQSLLMLWLMGCIINELWIRTSAVLSLFVLVFFAINPIFPCYAFCIGKDTNFAMAVTWLMLILYRLIRHQKQSPLPLIIACLLCVLLRNAGAWIVFASLVAAVFYQLQKKADVRALLLTLGTSLAIFCFAALGLPTILELQHAKPSENYSVPLQQVARIAATNGLTQEESLLIDDVLPVEKLADVYQPELSDPVKNLWREGTTRKQQVNFFKGWLHAACRNPLTAFSATFHNAYGYLYPGYLHPAKPAFLVGNQYGTQPMLEGENAYTINPNGETLKYRLNRLLQNPAARYLLMPGLYGSFAVLTFILSIRKKQGLWISVLPALLVLIGSLFSPVNGYVRYAMPLYLSAGVSILCCADLWKKESR